MNVPEEVLKEIEATEVDIEWDYRDELGPDRIAQILEGKDMIDIEIEIQDEIHESVNDLEYETVAAILKNHSIDVDVTDFLSFYGTYPTVNLNLERLAHYTTSYISVVMNLESLGYSHRHTTYRDMAKEFTFWNIDPREFNLQYGWPRLADRHPKPERNGQEYISPKSFAEQYINWAQPNSHPVFLLDSRTTLKFIIHNQMFIRRDGIVLKKGCPFTYYDYWNGGGSVIGFTQRDMRLKPGTFKFKEESKSHYGILACYGGDIGFTGKMALVK